MNSPNFLIIGAAKSGTSALYYYLKQHPDVFMPAQKELRYFSSIDNPENDGPNVYKQNSITSLEAYLHQFDQVTTETAIGEVSPQYLYYPKTASRIKSALPDVKLVVILRNPIERAYSSFLHAVRDWHEDSSSFKEALQKEEDRIKRNWPMLFHYVNAGFYSTQLNRYFDSFKREQIKIILYDDFYQAPYDVISNLFLFLEVENNFKPDISFRPNRSGFPKSRILHKLYRSIFRDSDLLREISKKYIPKDIRGKLSTKLRNLNMSKKHMDQSDRLYLTGELTEEIHQLEDLLHKDLSSWINIEV